MSLSVKDIQTMIIDLNHLHSNKLGLRINLQKTKINTNSGKTIKITINSKEIEQVDSYVYSSQKITTNKKMKRKI